MSAPTTKSLSGSAFATLLLIAFMMGANHVAARLAFDHGVSVSTAVLFRSGATALVVWLIVRMAGVPLNLPAGQKRALLKIGALISVQSLCLYSAVARLPVALALLAFNTYPLWTALWARLVYGHRPHRNMVRAMPVMLLGLALALDVLGAASGLGAAGHWSRIGAGVAFALTAAATVGLALVLTFMAFALFKALSNARLARDFSVLENNCTQSIATAAGFAWAQVHERVINPLVERQLPAHFLRIELLVGLIGGLMPAGLFLAHTLLPLGATAPFKVMLYGMVGLIGVLVGLVIVYQVLSTDVADHLREYATFKAMGYPHRFFLGIVFEQAVILGAMAAYFDRQRRDKRLDGIVKRAIAGLKKLEPAPLATAGIIDTSFQQVLTD